jgi:hypothetical protein
MKTTTAPAIVRIEEEILRKFQPVNETLATHIFQPAITKATKSFGAVDLWKCHKNRQYSGIKIS